MSGFLLPFGSFGGDGEVDEGVAEGVFLLPFGSFRQEQRQEDCIGVCMTFYSLLGVSYFTSVIYF